MKMIVVAVLSLFAGVVQAAQSIDIPIETIDVVRNQPSSPRWEEYTGISQENAVAVSEAAGKGGGACHEIAEHQILVCYFAAKQPRQVGLDWEKVGEAMSADAGQLNDIEVHW